MVFLWFSYGFPMVPLRGSPKTPRSQSHGAPLRHHLGASEDALGGTHLADEAHFAGEVGLSWRKMAGENHGKCPENPEESLFSDWKCRWIIFYWKSRWRNQLLGVMFLEKKRSNWWFLVDMVDEKNLCRMIYDYNVLSMIIIDQIRDDPWLMARGLELMADMGCSSKSWSEIWAILVWNCT